MTAAAIHLHAGQVVAHTLRARWPRHTEKHVADEFGVGLSTARGWIAGRLPANKYLLEMQARFGKGFVAELLAHAADWSHEFRLEAQIEALERQVADVRAEYAKRGMR